MIQLNNFIYEKLKLNKDINIGVLNNIDIKQLKYFTPKDINKIINWINNDMPEDIRPVVITNNRNCEYDEPSLHLFLFFTEDYNKQGPYEIPYIRFWYDDEGLSIDIYDNKDTKYYRSAKYKDSKDLDKCFDYIEKQRNIIKNIIK